VPTYSRYPVTNKLRFFQQPDLDRYETILLLDCDTLVVQNPFPALDDSLVQAKIVPRIIIEHQKFATIFRALDVPLPAPSCRTSLTGEKIIPYFNTGVVCINARAIESLIPRWIGYVDRLIQRVELLTPHEWFIEQVALSLAVASGGCAFSHVGNELNFQIHFPREHFIPEIARIDPRIVHYHGGVTARKTIARTAYRLANARIEEFNRRQEEEASARPVRPAPGQISCVMPPGENGMSPNLAGRSVVNGNTFTMFKNHALHLLDHKRGRFGAWLAGYRYYDGEDGNSVGRAQIEFMVEMGLEPHHVLLDIGCGPLRAGVDFISYLNSGNYLGIDRDARLIKLGRHHELGRNLMRLKAPEFVVSDAFEFEKFSKRPDLSLAHSVFTQIAEHEIRLCLSKLRDVVNTGHKCYATFHLEDGGRGQRSGIKYSRTRIEEFGRLAGWRSRYIDEWRHTAGETMVEYVAV
jgi:hypothetical protein